MDDDLGFCPRCACDMSGEPPSAVICGACTEPED